MMVMMSMLLLLMLVLVWMVQGELVDIKKEVANILKKHNKERSNTRLKAADMLEMVWDDGLATQAGEYSERCHYGYPKAKEFDVGSNLHYEVNFVKGPKTVHRVVNTAIKSWSRTRDSFIYSTECERACTYVQMIQSQTNKIGCALSNCQNLDLGDEKENYAAILVCFYSPRQNLQDTFPFKTGFPCSECPLGAICRDGVCSQLEIETVPSYVQDSPAERAPPQRQPSNSNTDVLTDNEKYYLRSTHNRLRETSKLDLLEWDPYLEKWAQWIINCNVDYPGPIHSYTNFHRLDQGAQVYHVVYDWAAEGENTNVDLDHGCRTPRDSNTCNHNTNVLQPSLTSMACAAMDCLDNTRQLVCVYDNTADRQPRTTVTTRRPFFIRI